ncbi:MAG: carboxypeptidase regulatory-like domain-containing protein [Acidobacteriota bacterium]|nr:carboxypeptidase regulatory-like domain-containing protein [Acidobacteriota bacterium]
MKLQTKLNKFKLFSANGMLMALLFLTVFCCLSTSEAYAQIDLAVTKTTTQSTVIAGSNITYTITFSNIGSGTSNQPQLSDTLPTNTTFVSFTQNNGPTFSCTAPAPGAGGTVSCSGAVLSSNQSAQFTLVVNVDSGTANGTVISNTADVSDAFFGFGDPSENNSSTANTTVGTTSAASVTVSGRVLSANGRGIKGILIRLINEEGEVRTALSSPFGYFRFADVPAGRTYMINVSAKKYSFTQHAQLLNLSGDVDNINFVADN